MQKQEQLYEGKAKKVFATDDPALLIVSYKDDATAFNGKKRGTIAGKGVINNRMSNALMRRLASAGVPTHFVEELSDRENAAALTDVRGDVRLDHVAFGYEEARTIIHDLSLRAEAGKLVAIVGPTGAGKTTIINLLMRFYDPDSGVIRIDGQEIRTAARRSVRSAYAMVLQDTWVFQGTIFENIAYGRENATMEEVVAAAKAARIHPFIMRLPQGYDTVISEDGGNISKGQKQLLTIARAMLYNNNMLILDEATSNVDTATERQVQKAIRSLMKGRTCFVIAHRLSTIQNADRILVIDHGDVVEQGTHESLMAQKGFYYKLYASQFS